MPGISQRHFIFLLHSIDAVVDSFRFRKLSTSSFLAVEPRCTCGIDRALHPMVESPQGFDKSCLDAS
jgi:hypothetical protein